MKASSLVEANSSLVTKILPPFVFGASYENNLFLFLNHLLMLPSLKVFSYNVLSFIIFNSTIIFLLVDGYFLLGRLSLSQIPYNCVTILYLNQIH